MSELTLNVILQSIFSEDLDRGPAVLRERRFDARATKGTAQRAEQDRIVVHEEHGIGRFLGLETLDLAGGSREFMVLGYKSGDKLKVPIEAFDRIQKHTSTEGARPQIDRLKDRYRCLAFDHRGHGGSEVTASGYEMDNLYADAIAHPNVLKVVALSGGYSREEANARMARQHGVVARTPRRFS